MAIELFHKILKTAVNGGSSDIHIKVNSPIFFRINGDLIQIESPEPTAEIPLCVQGPCSFELSRDENGEGAESKVRLSPFLFPLQYLSCLKPPRQPGGKPAYKQKPS